MIVRLWKGGVYKSMIIKFDGFNACRPRNMKMFYGGGLHFNVQILIFGFKSYNYGFELRLFNASLVYVG